MQANWQTHITARSALQFIKGDIQSGDLLSYILETEQIDTVMHFAAQVIEILSTLTPVLACSC